MPAAPADDPGLRRLVLASLLAALMAAGAWVRIPIGPVPFILSDLFAVLGGVLLGPRTGAAAAGTYVLAGAIGLPVFAGGTGGIAHLQGPTGGYLVGYVLAALCAGLVARKTWPFDLLAATTGWLVIFACGLTWLQLSTDSDWTTATASGLWPFLPVTAAKIACVTALAPSARRVL